METEEHAERLKNYCLAIGKELRLSVKELDELALLAVLHDIGKVGICLVMQSCTGNYKNFLRRQAAKYFTAIFQPCFAVRRVCYFG